MTNEEFQLLVRKLEIKAGKNPGNSPGFFMYHLDWRAILLRKLL
ncbi:hypothetical protein [Neobacillus sp. LXY-1]